MQKTRWHSLAFGYGATLLLCVGLLGIFRRVAHRPAPAIEGFTISIGEPPSPSPER